MDSKFDRIKKQNDIGVIEGWFAEVCDKRCGMLGLYLSMYKDPDEAQMRLYNEMCDDCPLTKIHMRYVE